MLTLFSGEFLTNPVPMEMILGACDYKCTYCYARGKTTHRQANLVMINNLIKKAMSEPDENLSLLPYLLKYRYPIAISNHVDPFCKNNIDTTLEILKLLDFYDIPIFWETKGGDRIAEILENQDFLEGWYFTISSDNDVINKRYEPGAPPFSERMKQIEMINALGHCVIIGINPYVPEWWNDMDGFLARLKSMKIKHIWLEPLHLSGDHIRRFTDREKEILGEKLIIRGRRAYTPEITLQIKEFIEQAKKYNIMVYNAKSLEIMDFWKDLGIAYGGRVYPTLMDFKVMLKELALEQKKNYLIIEYGIFEDFMKDRLPPFEIDFRTQEFIGGIDRNFVKDKIDLRRSRGFPGVLWSFFTQWEFRGGLCHDPHFALLVEAQREGDKVKSIDILTDDKDYNLLVFSVNGVGTSLSHIDTGVLNG